MPGPHSQKAGKETKIIMADADFLIIILSILIVKICGMTYEMFLVY
jgi:hypothetical protein